MNSVGDIKRYMLLVLARLDGIPLPEKQLTAAVNAGITPRPLLSDINEARRGLEADQYIQGAKDDLDSSITTWTLTDKGTHKAKALG